VLAVYSIRDDFLAVYPHECQELAPDRVNGQHNSRRTLPKKRSQTAFARGARQGVRMTAMPLASAIRANATPNLPSLSRMRYRGNWSKGVASRSCWANQTSVGWRVTPTWTTRRVPSAITKNA
jgi:hypothetical protein